MPTKFIFVTGGVCSSLGKGIASASIGALLKAAGFKVDVRGNLERNHSIEIGFGRRLSAGLARETEEPYIESEQQRGARCSSHSKTVILR